MLLVVQNGIVFHDEEYYRLRLQLYYLNRHDDTETGVALLALPFLQTIISVPTPVPLVMLPKTVQRVVVPPIKCHGTKTRLVRFILGNICWDGHGRWIEPFLGSGAVLFNVQPQRALVSDINPHIIRFYQMVYEGRITPRIVYDYLSAEGQALARYGESYYYAVRDRFNQHGDTLDFLFLSRACFNGLMRFNRDGKFNVPFCQKPSRFREAYVTKVANDVASLQAIMRGKQWEFRVADWQETLREARAGDFVYLDPPYIGRYTDYYQQWSATDAAQLAEAVRKLPCGFAVSMWVSYRQHYNAHVAQHWHGLVERRFTHYYHIGSTLERRGHVVEALFIKPDYAA